MVTGAKGLDNLHPFAREKSGKKKRAFDLS
jgi:hypothetical protein